MVDVTSKNFEDVLPEVFMCIEQASFIAIDTEFSGLPSGRQKSLFDNIEERYAKLHHEVQGIIIVQFGLTTFTKDFQNNRYNANNYTFYLRPPSFASVDKTFTFQASALKFLYNYNFDFNKCFRDGIEYLNETEDRLLQNDMKTKSFLQFLQNENEQDLLLEKCCLISQWLMKSKDERMVLDDEKLKGIDDYIIFSVLRERNPCCWAYRDEENKLIVERVSMGRRKELCRDQAAREEKKFFQTILGFSRVFRKLVECKKPIVGHNCLCDLLLLFQQFHQQLPSKFKTFREEMLSLFPVIFDTKHICLQVKKDLEDLVSLGRGDLFEMYSTLRKSSSSSELYYSPDVCLPKINSLKETPHHAGFDSYACGYILVKLAHLLSVRKLEGRSKPMTWVEHLDALAPHQNKINLIRSGDHYLDLSGGVSCDKRPNWLYIKSNASSSTLDITKLTDLLSSYGTVDIKSLSKNSALIAVGNIGCARDIVRAFYDNPDYHITSYSHLHHSTSGRMTLWSMAACFTGFGLAFIFQLVKTLS